MYNSWFEETRSGFEAIETLEQAIISEMLSIQDNPKEKSIAEHRINNFLQMVQDKAKFLNTFINEEVVLKKQQIAVIQGHKSLKPTDKKKPTDVIWQNFYDKAKELKDLYRKQQINSISAKNTVQYYRGLVFSAPFKEPEFSMEQNKGKYVDMHVVYLEFLNVCKIMEDSKETTRLHDYLWFLQNMDKFDDFPINKKFKCQAKYVSYLNDLYDYLSSFLQRSKPLYNYKEFEASFTHIFAQKYSQGKVIGWDHQSDHFDESKASYCSCCKKLFITNEAFVSHLMGKRHIKLEQQEHNKASPQQEENARQQYKKQSQERKKNLAFLEFRISRLREELATVIYDTMNLVRKKQARGYEQVEEAESQSSSEEQTDAPIYNPKNLPLGWDGKPIPYWLYKLHGLGIEYKCQICGNYSYWGRRAFQMHFQQWRHTYGMKCLKIPNTIHFKDITTINDALSLHQKLMRQSQQAQFRPDMEEEFQDNEGNLLNKKTYLDMKKQGLIE